jgi:ABC-type oligopeptide transport system substrate-binding subunit
MAKARRLAPLACVLVLAGCGGSSAPEPPHGGAVLRFALPLLPTTLDPAKVADLPSLNVVHELNAGLTRFSGRGVEPDLAESWDVSDGGLVWTFHLRKGLRWSDDAPLTAEDFRRAWLRALAPATRSAFARAEMQNIRGARRYRVTGSGEVGVEAVDDRTLRVTLQHAVPWLDEQVAWPVFFPLRESGTATSGPFRLASRSKSRLVLERNFNYWNVAAVKPRQLVFTTSTDGADAVLPRGVLPPGFPWVPASEPAAGGRPLPTLSRRLLWLVTRGTPLADPEARRAVFGSLLHLPGGLASWVPPAMPGASTIAPQESRATVSSPQRLRLTLAYTNEDPGADRLVSVLRSTLAADGIELTLKAVPTLTELVRLAGPPAQPGIDVVLLGWGSEFFDQYNILDLFPCASAFNVARWCDRSYDRLMHQAVRELDDQARYEIERDLVRKLDDGLPAIPLDAPPEQVELKAGVRGFRWSPIGFYELLGMTRS